jgi:hypothetical protein
VCAGERVFATGFMTGVAYVALSIAGLVAVEVVEGRLAARWDRSVVAVMGVEAVVNVAKEAMVSVEPWASANEYAAVKPVGAIVAVRCAVVRCIVEVSIGAGGFDTDTDRDLGRANG